jgi:hypothetical protein
LSGKFCSNLFKWKINFYFFQALKWLQISQVSKNLMFQNSVVIL